MIVLILVAVSFGGLAEIVPLFWQKATTEPISTLRPYSALEMAGRDCSESSHKETCGHNPQEWGQALLSEKCLDHRSGNRDDHKEQRCEKERQAKDGV